MSFLKRNPNVPIAALHAFDMKLKVLVTVIMILIVIVKAVDINYIKTGILWKKTLTIWKITNPHCNQWL